MSLILASTARRAVRSGHRRASHPRSSLNDGKSQLRDLHFVSLSFLWDAKMLPFTNLIGSSGFNSSLSGELRRGNRGPYH